MPALTADEIKINLDAADGQTILVTIKTPLGLAEVLGDVRFDERTLFVEGAHIEASMRGALGRTGINAISRSLLVEANVKRIVIQGSVRATGKYVGRLPTTVVFPR